MVRVLRPDICVIGAGAGGIAVAEAAAAVGASVVLVERDRLGGAGLNHGSMPCRALLVAAGHARAMRTADRFGLPTVDPTIDMRQVMQSVRDVIAAGATAVSAGRLSALGVTGIKAEARFKDRRTLVAGDAEIRARRFVLATGTALLIPNISGLGDVDYLTAETVFDLAVRPDHLIVVGAGTVGLSLAQAFRRLGSAVTVIEAATPLGEEDPEMAAVILRRLAADGVRLLERTRVTGVERHGEGGVRVAVEGPVSVAPIEASHLLIAAGRAPDTGKLDLKRGGVALQRNGAAVSVSAMLRTTNGRVYAIGGVTDPAVPSHLARHQARLVVRGLLFRLPAKQGRIVVPRLVATDPELAHAGLTEAQARAHSRSARILRWSYAENDRAQAERRTDGHAKLVADGSGRILGVTIAGANAGEMIGVWTLALQQGLTLRDMACHLAPYPTMGEIGKRAAMTYFARAAARPLARRLAGLLRLFG